MGGQSPSVECPGAAGERVPGRALSEGLGAGQIGDGSRLRTTSFTSRFTHRPRLGSGTHRGPYGLGSAIWGPDILSRDLEPIRKQNNK